MRKKSERKYRYHKVKGTVKVRYFKYFKGTCTELLQYFNGTF